jgi:hypothetical protein
MPDAVSLSIRDADGDIKSVYVFAGNGNSLSQLTGIVTQLALYLDPCIGGVIESASMVIGATLPGGLKTDAVAGSEVQRGALLSYLPENTVYRASYFFPSWLDAGFSGNEVSNTGDFATLIQALTQPMGSFPPGHITDRNANNLSAYIEGVKKFRK